MQSNLFSYDIISLIIGIGQGVLARWQEFIFMFIGNSYGLLARWQKNIFGMLLG